ncbi:MAG: hypothetical protein ACRECA_06310 [Pseudolabrys sp.]
MVTKQDEEKAPQTTAERIARAGAAKPGAQQSGLFRYIDRPECMETFADSVTGLSYDGQTLRLEFSVTRVDEVTPNRPVTGRRYPACRLALSPAAANDLINRVQQIANALKQAGTAKQAEKPSPQSN